MNKNFEIKIGVYCFKKIGNRFYISKKSVVEAITRSYPVTAPHVFQRLNGLFNVPTTAQMKKEKAMDIERVKELATEDKLRDIFFDAFWAKNGITTESAKAHTISAGL